MSISNESPQQTMNAILTAESWIHEQLAALGEYELTITPLQSSPVSAVSLIQTPTRRYFFKECQSLFAHEPPLTAALAQQFPSALPEIIAWDADNRWLLMGDAGPNLRDLTKADVGQIQWGRWEKMLRTMATLQKNALPQLDELSAAGLPDRRLHRLPALYAKLIADTPMLLIGQENGIAEADAARLPDLVAQLPDLCAKIAEYNVPETLHHDDFHAGNIGVSGEEYRIMDWGEACYAHPFYSLLMALRYAKYLFKADDATLDHLRDVYLKEWLDFEPLERLRELVTLTNRMGSLCRTGTWYAVLKFADDAYRAEDGDAFPYWLMTFVNDTPLA